MYLKSDPALAFTDFRIIDVYHLLTVEPCPDIVSLHFYTEGIPVAELQYVLFLVRNPDKPSSAIGLIDTAGIRRRSRINENIEKYNAELKKLAEEKGYHFADVASVMKDENGNLIPEYCSDPEDMGIHFTDAGAEAWIDYLLKNASSF